MNISELIRQNQDKSAMLNRALETQVKLYAEKTHFIYELLQNAEDAGATCVNFRQFASHLEILHDGKPFTLSNAQSLCDAANSDKNDGSGKIGKFGVGFKSVFAICNTVSLFSEPSNRPMEGALPKFALRIEHYTDPVNLDTDWNMEPPYTTRFVFPYDTGTYYKSIDELRHDVSRKLIGLGTSILLFMKNIKEINYYINGLGDASDSEGTYMLERQLLGEGICKVTALGETNNESDDTSYLMFSKQIDDTERTVDIAFSIDEQNSTVQFVKCSSPYVFVYFPTETESRLNFIVQAPFDLTPNRSSIERSSERNERLIEYLSLLFSYAITEIKNRKWLTLDFINLLPYDSSNPMFDPSWNFYPFHKKTLQLMMKEEMIPTIDGSYISIKDAKIQRSATLLDLFSGERLCEFVKNPKAKWLPKDFTENSPLKTLHGFLKELGAEEISSSDLPKLIRANPAYLQNANNDWLSSFYQYLATDVKNLLGKNGDLATVAFVKTSDGNISAPFTSKRKGNKYETVLNIYKRPKSISFSIDGFLFVDREIEETCPDFVELLGLSEPDNFDYFMRELELLTNTTVFDDDINVLHVRQAIKHLREEHENAIESFSMLLWLRVTDTNGCARYVKGSQNVYRTKDYNGVSLTDYFERVDCNAYVLDEAFYLSKGISQTELKLLEQIGVKNNVYQGMDINHWREGNAECFNIGDFKKRLSFAEILDVILAVDILHHKNEFTLVRKKSAILFVLLLNVEKHLQGESQYRRTNPVLRKDNAEIVQQLGGGGFSRWLLSNSGHLVNPSKITRVELNESVYGKVNKRSSIFDILGFKKTESDLQEELVREFMKQYTKEQIDSIIRTIVPEETEIMYDPDVDERLEAFPDEPIRDLRRLIDTVRKWHIRAPRVQYERVLRSIRTSRNNDKEHIKYRYNGYCQCCEMPSPFWEIAEIFLNPEKEFRQMNLSLCPSCASSYRSMRENRDLMREFSDNIVKANVSDDPCRVNLGKETIRFTKTHIAEIQEIIKLDRKASH